MKVPSKSPLKIGESGLAQTFSFHAQNQEKQQTSTRWMGAYRAHNGRVGKEDERGYRFPPNTKRKMLRWREREKSKRIGVFLGCIIREQDMFINCTLSKRPYQRHYMTIA
jgi:hypothetical protein